MDFNVVNLKDLQLYINMGRIKVEEDKPITMRHLVLSGLVSRIGDGVKLLGKGIESFNTPVNIEVSRASKSAIEGIEVRFTTLLFQSV